MTRKSQTKKSFTQRHPIEKLGEHKAISKQNLVDLDYYQHKKYYEEHIFDTLNPPIYTLRQFLEEHVYNYYIFVGPQNFEISSLLKNIQVTLNNNAKLELNVSEKRKLTSVFGKDYKKSLGLTLKNYNEFQYIFMLIEEEDNIETIKKKICIYINPNLKINSQYLWVNYDSDNRLIYQKKYKYFLKISNDRKIYLKNLLSSLYLICGKRITHSQLNLSERQQTLNFTEFEDNSSISKYIDFTHETLGFIYNDNLGLGLKNPFSDHNPNLFEVSSFDKRKYTLLHYGKIKNNLINMVVFKDFNNKHPNYRNVSKYWPNLNNVPKVNFNSEKKTFENMSQISNYLYLNPPSSKVIFRSFMFQQAIININSFDEISKSIEKEDFINLEKIFETVDLSYQVPLVRYNEGLLDNIRYKLYKPVTQINNGKIFIEKDRLLQWGNQNKKVRLKKGVHIYQLYGKKNDENEFQKIAISSDGKLELRVTWKNITANYYDIERAINKCKTFITYLNNEINYNIKLNNDDKIKIPCANVNTYKNSTTEISSVNCLITVEVLKSLEIHTIFEYCKNYLYNYVSIEIKKENNIEKSLILRYKRTDNYRSDNAVFTFLENNYKDSNVRDMEIINQINDLYKVGKVNGLALLNEYKKRMTYENFNNQFQRNMKSKSDGYHIQINKQFNKIFKVSLSGIKNHQQIKNIIHFIKTLFSLVIENNVLELANLSESNDIDKLIESVNSSFSSDSNPISDFEGDDEDFESFSDDEDNDMDHLTELKPEIILAKNNTKVPEKKEKKEAIAIDSRYIINRLKEYDGNIFNFNKTSLKNKSGYTKMCQGNEGRQPIVISQAEKDRIDKKYKGSYSEALKYHPNDPDNPNYYICPYIWCAKCNISLRPKDVKNDKTKTMTCPECGGVPFENSKKGINGTLFVKKHNFWTAKWESEFPSDNKWNQIYPSFLDPRKKKMSNDFCLPCCFKNKDTPRDKLAKDICINNKTIELVSSDKFEKYVSGWKKFPLEENRLGGLPEILNELLENNLKEAFNEGEAGNLKEDVPIFLRRGIKQSKANSLIDSVISLASSSAVKRNKKNLECLSNNIDDICNKITVEIFISLNDGDLISIFNDDQPLDANKYHLFYNWVLDKRIELDNFIDFNYFKSVPTFEKLEKIDDEKKYTFIKLYEVYNALTNFISYLKSNKIKDEQLLWELLSKKNIVFNENVNLIIFEVIDDKVYQMCPKWFNDQYVDHDFDTCLLIKQYNRFEPIFNIMDHTTDKDVFRNNLGRFHARNVKMTLGNEQFLLYDIRCITFILRNASDFCLEIENNFYKEHMNKYNYLYIQSSQNIFDCLVSIENKNYRPFYQILNDTFKCIGFIINDLHHCHSKIANLSNKVLIPCLPSRMIVNIPILFGTHHYIPNDYHTTIKTLFDIQELNVKITNYKTPIDFIILPKERIVDQNNYTYLLNTTTNYLIPVKKEKIVDKYPEVANSIDINLDYKINKITKMHDKRENNMNRYKLENNLYQQFRFELSKIISNSIKLNNTRNPLCNLSKFLVKNIGSLLSVNDRKVTTSKVIKEILRLSESFYVDDTNSVDIYQSFNKKTRKQCSVNTKPSKCLTENLCIWNNNKCYFKIPKYNLVNPKINNQELYIDLVVEELVRNKIKRNEIISGSVSEIISYASNPDEAIFNDDNFVEEVENLYNMNDNVLYNKKYPENGYDNYFIDNKFIKKPVTKKCLDFLKDSYTYNDMPGIPKKDISYLTLSKIADNESVHTIKNELLKNILKDDYKKTLKRYQLITFKNYDFIHSEKDLISYFSDKHYLNPIDIEIFSKIYKKNIIVIYFTAGNYIEHLKNNSSQQYYIILIFIKKNNLESIFTFYTVSMEHKILFDYSSFSSHLKRLIDIRKDKVLKLRPRKILEELQKKKSNKRTNPKSIKKSNPKTIKKTNKKSN